MMGIPVLLLFVFIVGLIGIAALLIVFLLSLRGGAASGKAKRRLEDAPRDPYPDDLADEGRLVLDDDGELPDWIDDLAEKPKRTDRE